MALRVGIVGKPNTGKSYSRKTIKKGEECFILAPSRKAFNLKTSEGKALQRLSINGVDYEQKVKEKFRSTAELFYTLSSSTKEIKLEGNWILCEEIATAEYALKFISDKMPHIKNIFIPDFTHFISAVLANRSFISRKSGGEAFQRFWELAGDTLNGFFLSIDKLREDLIIVTEYHSEYDEIGGVYEIFVPGGKMLKEKFLPDSYYDYMFYTHVELDPDTGEVLPEGYKFVTKKSGRYNARSKNIYPDVMVNNDLQDVLDKVRIEEGI